MRVGERQKVQALAGLRAEADTETQVSGEGDFKVFLDKSLEEKGAAGGNEEAVFSSIVQDGVTRKGSKEAIAKFEERVEKHRHILERNAGYVSEERAGKFALRDLVRNDLMSKEDATKLYSLAFSAAQLDDDKNALSDGMSAPGQVTSTASVDTTAVSNLVKEYEAGSKTFDMRRLGEKTTVGIDELAVTAAGSVEAGAGGAVDGANGFLFKPVSDTQGKLVVLAPEAFTGNIASVLLKDEAGKQVETGVFSGIGNGERAHFRFTKPGGSYPANLTVEFKLDNGEVKQYKIPNPALRYD